MTDLELVSWWPLDPGALGALREAATLALGRKDAELLPAHLLYGLAAAGGAALEPLGLAPEGVLDLLGAPVPKKVHPQDLRPLKPGQKEPPFTVSRRASRILDAARKRAEKRTGRPPLTASGFLIWAMRALGEQRETAKDVPSRRAVEDLREAAALDEPLPPGTAAAGCVEHAAALVLLEPGLAGWLGSGGLDPERLAQRLLGRPPLLPVPLARGLRLARWNQRRFDPRAVAVVELEVEHEAEVSLQDLGAALAAEGELLAPLGLTPYRLETAFVPLARQRLEGLLRGAVQEATRLGRRRVGPEHLLVSLLSVQDPVLERALAEAGCSCRTSLLRRLLADLGPPDEAGRCPDDFAPEVRQVLERAGEGRPRPRDLSVCDVLEILAREERFAQVFLERACPGFPRRFPGALKRTRRGRLRGTGPLEVDGQAPGLPFRGLGGALRGVLPDGERWLGRDLPRIDVDLRERVRHAAGRRLARGGRTVLEAGDSWERALELLGPRLRKAVGGVRVRAHLEEGRVAWLEAYTSESSTHST